MRQKWRLIRRNVNVWLNSNLIWRGNVGVIEAIISAYGVAWPPAETGVSATAMTDSISVNEEASAAGMAVSTA